MKRQILKTICIPALAVFIAATELVFELILKHIRFLPPGFLIMLIMFAFGTQTAFSLFMVTLNARPCRLSFTFACTAVLSVVVAAFTQLVFGMAFSMTNLMLAYLFGTVFGIVLSSWFSVQEADEAFAGD